MSVISNQSFYWVNSEDEIIYIPARYTVDSEGNAICTHTFNLEHIFDECTSVDDYGLYNAFYECTGLTGSVSFPKLTSIGANGLSYAFQKCTGITSVSFPKLTSIDIYGLYFAFYYCTGITGSVSFPELISVGNYGLYSAFQICTGLTGSVSFPKLTSIGNNGLNNAFNGCTRITEIHFRSDAQSTVEATGGYGSKFGATNATIYFDL